MIVQSVDHGGDFDFGKTSAMYAKFRDIYPPELYERLSALGVGQTGTRWLDLGTGTGVLPFHLYKDGAVIVGADVSAQQIGAAKAAAREKGASVDFIVSPAETLPFADGTFDCVTAAQCFWYFDREKAIAEIRRVLTPNGLFVKVYLAWSLRDPIARRSYQLTKRLNPAWSSGSTGYRDVYDHPFPDGRVDVIDCDLPFTRETWHGRMCACRGTLASMDKATFALWDARHRKMLEKCPESFTVRHRLYIASYRVGSDGSPSVAAR